MRSLAAGSAALKNIGESWGFLPSAKAQVMVTNHDYERSGGSISYKDGAIYRLANVFMLGWVSTATLSDAGL